VIDTIETYVWNPSALSDDERARVGALLRADPVVRDWADFLSQVRSNLPDATAPLPSHVRRFAESLYTSPRRIRLRVSEMASAAGTMTLAAATTDSQSRFVPFGSIVNRREGVLVRFLMDRGSGSVRGYVLSDNEEVLKTALFVPGSARRPLCPNACGMVQFTEPENQQSLSVDEQTAVLLPVSRARVEPGCTDDTRTLSNIGGRQLMRIFIEESYFTVEFLADDVLATHAVDTSQAALLSDGERIPRSALSSHEFRAYVR